ESYFFFQAEDGIRDFHVTGVQTCALPILIDSTRLTPCRVDQFRNAPPGGARVHHEHCRLTEERMHCTKITRWINARLRLQCEVRSEERRVGKEGRSWESLNHENRNI